MMRGPCGGRAIDLEASAASAIVVSPGLAAARLPITAGSRPLTHARPHPSPGRRRCPPAASARSSDSPGPVEDVADDRLGGGAAGLSTPQELSQENAEGWTSWRTFAQARH